MEKGAETSSTDLVVSSTNLTMGTTSTNSTQGDNLDRPFSGDDDMGPTNKSSSSSSSGANEVVLGITLRDDDDNNNNNKKNNNNNISSSHQNVVCAENIAKSCNSTNLQPFEILPSPGGGGMVCPFTYTQWKELERQAMIFKYMISSVPVPPHLIFPLSTNFPAPPHYNSYLSSIYNNGRYSRNGDPEPGRCKRTDGKKWRCAKEVAPHQKYCERHLHRGRPRSRKPVEAIKNNLGGEKKTRPHQPNRPSLLPKARPDFNVGARQFVAMDDGPLLLFDDKTDLSICTPYHKGSDGDLSLMMENETVEKHVIEQPWQHLMEPSMGLANDGYSNYTSSPPIFHQDYASHQPFNIFSYPNFPTSEIDAPSNFIDAWSIDNLDTKSNISLEPSLSMINDENFSPSLNLSMAMGSKNCDDDHHNNKAKDNPIWLSTFSCEPFARGGPLGEALQLVGGSNPTSPYNSIATTVSSPSGVLHRTMFSHSDNGSVCNSPTFGPPP